MCERGALSFACTFNGFLENVACLMAVGKIFVGHREEQQLPQSGGCQHRSWTVSVCNGIRRGCALAPEPEVVKTAH